MCPSRTRRVCINSVIVSALISLFFLCGYTDVSFRVGLEIAELKAAALEHIRCSLTPENVVTEICSPFTARFPEVRKIEKEYLKANWVRNLFFL